MKFDPEEVTRSGCGSNMSLLRGWQKEEGVRGEGEATERLGRSLSSLLSQCHTLWPLSVTISLYWPGASGGWHSASPSIRPSLPLWSSYTSTSFVSRSQPPIWFVYVKGISSCSPHHWSPSPPFLPVQSYWFWPEALGCPPFCCSPVPIPSMGQGHVPVAAVESSKKQQQENVDIRKEPCCGIMIDWCKNADSAQRKWPIFWHEALQHLHF